MKKILALMLAAFMAVGSMTACSSAAGKATKDNKKIKIVTTIFPEYDWVMNVLGDKASDADVTMLLDKGVDLHSFKPSAEDILKVSTCDLFVYVGGESDKWVEGALKEATNKNMITINLMNVLGDSVKEEEIVEGMQGEDDHDHDHDEDHDHDGDHDHEHEHEHDEVEYDEHVWLSLRNASALVKSISEALQKIDAANAETYKKNAETYTGKLSALDADYKKAVEGASNKTVLFGDRFPFRYMTDDYGLKYYAAFVGCSAESEASFETIVFLSKKVDELSLPAVLTIEGKDHRIAKTIVDNTQKKDQKILSLDSMQSTTMEDVKNGASYLKIMESNLSVLKEALK
ncbi:MAG: zinc ABC transporter substrate-binding protein [Clostridiales bacterium]|nr:zinc ABC transporter substrate-binding protein [Clostridiales bacterium]